MQIALTFLLALVPALIWGYVFYTKDPVYRPKALQSFLLGISSVAPILFYKWSWKVLPEVSVFHYTDQLTADLFSFTPHLFLPLGSVFAFMFVGVIEEYMKNLVVRHADRGFFRNIDDAIEFSILAALGFAFFENILYLQAIWAAQGTETMLTAFLFRGVFSTFAHILFSGIFGYYYGLAYFAEPIWAEEQRSKRHILVQFLHKVLHMKADRVFAVEMHTTGLLLAVILHAGFNLLLELGFTGFLVPFLILGYAYLDHLFQKKENLKAYGYLVGEGSPAHLHHMFWQKLPRFKKLA
jgi:RsiW-degrading membrane proteinase PrsW (M82 family)